MRGTRARRLVLAVALCALGLSVPVGAGGQSTLAAASPLDEEPGRYKGPSTERIKAGPPSRPTPVEEGAFYTELPASGGTGSERALVYTMKDPKATLRVTMVNAQAGGSWLTLKAMDERYCGVSVATLQFGQLPTGRAATTKDSPTCAGQDQFLIVLENYTEDKLPTRLHVIEEPVTSDPGWGDVIRMPVGPPAATDPVSVEGGETMDDLPVMDSGSYTLSLGPNSQQWFAVPLTYGEGLNVEAVFSAVEEGGSTFTIPPYGAVEVYDPMMLGYAADEGRDMLDRKKSTTLPVKVPALGASTIDEEHDIGPHLPSVYRLAVSVEDYEGKDIEVQLNVERFGEPEPGPTYASGDWSYEDALGITYTGTGDPMDREEGTSPTQDEPTQGDGDTDQGADGGAGDGAEASTGADDSLGKRQLAGGVSVLAGAGLVAAGGVLLARRRRTT